MVILKCTFIYPDGWPYSGRGLMASCILMSLVKRGSLSDIWDVSEVNHPDKECSLDMNDIEVGVVWLSTSCSNPVIDMCGHICFCPIFTSRGDIYELRSFSTRSILTDLDVLPLVYLFLRGENFISRSRNKNVHCTRTSNETM